MKIHLRSGFTLIEMIVTIAVASLLFIALMTMIVVIYRANSASLEQAQYLDSARQAIAIFTRDAREIDYAVTGAYPLVTLSPNEFSFYSDIDPDDMTEYIIYELASSSLVRRVYSAAGTPPTYNTTPDTVSVLATNVRNHEVGSPLFTYFDGASNEVADPDTHIVAIRSVQMTLIINPDDMATTSNFVLDGKATLRNLRDRL